MAAFAYRTLNNTETVKTSPGKTSPLPNCSLEPLLASGALGSTRLNLHCGGYTNPGISLEMELTGQDLPAFPLPESPYLSFAERNELSVVYLIALKKSVQVLEFPMGRTFWFFPVFHPCWANLGHSGASALGTSEKYHVVK